MEKDIQLSIIVPVYNTENYLIECIESLINQTLENIEIILVDDGSKDNSGKICDTYASKYAFIKVIHNENIGLGYTRNIGIENAEGMYITFIDSDDFVREDYYEKMIEVCRKEQADVCFANGIINYKENKLNYVHFYKDVFSLKFDDKDKLFQAAPRVISQTTEKKDDLSGSVCLGIFKTSFIKDNNICFLSEREFISEDIWFNLDCFLAANKIVYADAMGYFYRYNNNSLTRKYNPGRFELLIKSEEMLMKHCSDLKLKDYEKRVAMHFWASFKKCINQEVRYKSHGKGITNIKDMCENNLSEKLINMLVGAQSISKLDKYLLKIIRLKEYKILYIELKIYNCFVHHKNN